MPTSKEFLSYLFDSLKNSPDITVRPMMGEYLLYFRGKLVGGIYDNRLLVKYCQTVIKMLPDATMQLPYVGATNPMISVEDIDDGEFLKSLFAALYDELPEPKIKKKGNKKNENH